MNLKFFIAKSNKSMYVQKEQPMHLYHTLFISPFSYIKPTHSLIMKTRTKAAQDNDEGITSPSVNVGPNPSVTSKLLTIKLGPLTQKSSPQSALNAVDGGSHQHPKHGHSDSDADTEVTVPNLCQPSAKRTKNSNTTSPVKSGQKAVHHSHT
jgi:hypothetical protein